MASNDRNDLQKYSFIQWTYLQDGWVGGRFASSHYMSLCATPTAVAKFHSGTTLVLSVFSLDSGWVATPLGFPNVQSRTWAEIVSFHKRD